MSGKPLTHHSCRLWNTQVIDSCVVFNWWHIRGPVSFLVSIFIIVALGVAFEGLRLLQRNLDVRVAAQITRARAGGLRSGRESPLIDVEESLLLGQGLKTYIFVSSTINHANSLALYLRYPVPPKLRLQRAGLYGVSVFLSFFLMLVFMTYNVTWLLTHTSYHADTHLYRHISSWLLWLVPFLDISCLEVF